MRSQITPDNRQRISFLRRESTATPFPVPGYRDVDLNIAKAFGLPNMRVLGENARFEIKANMLNAFNLLNINPSQPFDQYRKLQPQSGIERTWIESHRFPGPVQLLRRLPLRNSRMTPRPFSRN